MLTGFYSTVIAAISIVQALPAAPPGQVPYTLYQLPLQDNFVKNAANIKGKFYEKYFRPDLFVYPEMVEPGRLAIDCTSQALNLTNINTLLVPASVTLPYENAWCSYQSGQGYVASRTHFPGATGDMISWWFWWHSNESARYSLWHPWAHVSVASECANKFNDTTLNNTAKYVGCTQHVTEIIGETELTVDIKFKTPSYFGLDESKFAANGIVASACAEIYFGTNSPIKAVNMIHLWYTTDNGLDLRSRYFLADNIKLDIPVLGMLFPIDWLATVLGIKKTVVGRALSYLQFHHDQQEFTHLASILPDMYNEYGNGAK